MINFYLRFASVNQNQLVMMSCVLCIVNMVSKRMQMAVRFVNVTNAPKINAGCSVNMVSKRDLMDVR